MEKGNRHFSFIRRARKCKRKMVRAEFFTALFPACFVLFNTEYRGEKYFCTFNARTE